MNEHGYISIKLYLQEQVVGQFWFMGHGLPVLGAEAQASQGHSFCNVLAFPHVPKVAAAAPVIAGFRAGRQRKAQGQRRVRRPHRLCCLAAPPSSAFPSHWAPVYAKKMGKYDALFFFFLFGSVCYLVRAYCHPKQREFSLMMEEQRVTSTQ